MYKEGDSWCEELGFSRSEFDSAIKKIGKKVKKGSKKEGALVFYWTDTDRKTYYDLNIELLELKLNELYPTLRKVEKPLYEKQDFNFTESRKAALHNTETTTEINTEINTNNVGLKNNNKTKEKDSYISKEQIEKLEEMFPGIDYVFYTEKIKSYAEEKGKVYKDYYRTILNWARKDVLRNGSYDKKVVEELVLKELESFPTKELVDGKIDLF